MSHLVEIQKTLCTCRLLGGGHFQHFHQTSGAKFPLYPSCEVGKIQLQFSAVTEGHSGNSEMLQAATSRSIDVFEKLEQVGEGTYGQVR